MTFKIFQYLFEVLIKVLWVWAQEVYSCFTAYTLIQIVHNMSYVISGNQFCNQTNQLWSVMLCSRQMVYSMSRILNAIYK